MKLVLKDRLRQLQDHLTASGHDGCLIEQRHDLFYFLDAELSAGALLVTRKSAALFVDGRYLEKVAEVAAFLNLELLRLDLPTMAFFFQAHTSATATLLLRGDSLTTDQFLAWKKEEVLSKGKMACVVDTKFFVPLRAIKSAREIDLLRKAAELTYQGFLFLKEQLVAGITEVELARRFQIFGLEHGADGVAFPPIIAFGKNSALPHHTAGETPLTPGAIVLMDLGFVLSGYHADMTRTFFWDAAGDPELKRLLQIAHTAHQAAIHACAPGVSPASLDQLARKVMAEHGVETLFVHSLGHGVGIEIHEYPRIQSDAEGAKITLAPQMAITIEPGLYQPGLGGVRVEDTVIITEQGCYSLYA